MVILSLFVVAGFVCFYDHFACFCVVLCAFVIVLHFFVSVYSLWSFSTCFCGHFGFLLSFD